MDIYSGNKNATGDFRRVAQSIENKSQRNTHCVEVARIISVTNNEYQCETLAQQFKFIAAIVQGLSVTVGDIVVVVFADTDFRINLKKVKNYMAISETENGLHSMSYGIIIGKL